MYEVHITPVLNGYVCKVGCQTLVFDSTKTLLVELEKYLKDPRETEVEYRKNALNHKWILSNEAQGVPPTSRAYTHFEYPPQGVPQQPPQVTIGY